MDNKNQILEKIRSDSSMAEITCEELEKQLDSELAKSSPDFDLVDELTTAILEAKGMTIKEVDIQNEIDMIKRRGIRRFRCPKWAVAVGATCVVLTGANMLTISAFGMNIISAVVQITKGGFTVDFDNPKEEIHLPTYEDDPYGFIAKLAEYGIEFETPHYIPEGFVLTEVSTNVNENVANSVRFLYEYKQQTISLSYKIFWNDVSNIVIPSDHYNISETEVNGSPAIISKEDDQYTITYQNGKTVFVMFTVDVPYDECEKIVASIK